MSQKQLNPTNGGVPEFGPHQLGNQAAKDAGDKTKAALDTVYVDQDALLLAERNDVLDAAIARLGENAERWIRERLVLDKNGNVIIEDCDITEMMAEVMRERGHGFCLVGAIGAELGPHSRATINQAISAVARAIDPHAHWEDGYGFSRGNVYRYNDRQRDGRDIVGAMRRAKALPLE